MKTLLNVLCLDKNTGLQAFPKPPEVLKNYGPVLLYKPPLKVSLVG